MREFAAAHGAERLENRTMRIHVLMAFTVVVGFLAGPGAQAQQPSPPAPAAHPAAPPSAPRPEYGLPINNEQAKAAAAAAIDEAKKNGWRMVIAIAGTDGELAYLEKMDGTQNASPALAERKARTSALYRQPSKAFADQFAAGNIGFMTFPDHARPIASEGGIPIIVNGKLIGAIGVSGGTGPQDGVVANAGAAAVN
jgi:glc operon protein GlcG